MKHLGIILTAIALGAAGQLLLKSGMMAHGEVQMSSLVPQLARILTRPTVFIGFLCFGVSAVLWLVVLSRVPLSIAYPMVSLNYVVIILASRLLFHEALTPWKLTGVALICLGVLALSRG